MKSPTSLPTTPTHDIRHGSQGVAVPTKEVLAPTPQKATLVQKVVFSGIAASVGVLFTNPIDVVKVRLQSQKIARSNERAKYRGMLHAFVKIPREEGLGGLWKGVGVAVLRSSTYGGIRLGSYGPLRDWVDSVAPAYLKPKPSTSSDPGTTGQQKPKDQTGILVKVIAAVISGSFSAFLTNPLELLKVRQQGCVGAARLSLLGTLRQVAAQRGTYLALWDGTAASMLRSAVLTVAQAGSYDHIKHALISHGLGQDTLPTHACSSALAGLITTTLISPFDVVKTRLMQHKGTAYTSAWDCVRQTVGGEGVVGLMKGWLPNYVRQGPQTLILWVVYEQLCKWSHVYGM